MTIRILSASVLSLAFALAAQAGPPAPRLGPVELVQPLPSPYDSSADANAAVEQALARAQATGKRVLIDLGGNWCPDCRVFAAVMQLPEVRQFVGRHFEVVLVDVGRFTNNLDIPARFGVDKVAAVPMVLILSPQGRLLNADDLVALSDARAMTPQAVLDWLAKWAA